MNILISGIGGPTPKGIANSLRLSDQQFKIIGMDADRYAPGLYSNPPYDKTYKVPNPGNDVDRYWSRVCEIVDREEIDYAFIVPETEVIQWSKRMKDEGLPCPSNIPPVHIATFLFDKLKVCNFLEPFGYAPKTIIIENSESSFGLLEKELKYPYWVRQNNTAGALGAFKINSKQDIAKWLYINNNDVNFIASPFLPGGNYACKLLYKDDKLIMAAVGERIVYLLSNVAPSGISGMCSRGRLRNRKDIYEIADQAIRKIYEHFKSTLTGMFTIDFKEDSQGNPMITEINLRHVSFTYAFSLGGANFAIKTIEAFVENNLRSSGLIGFEEELNFIRGVDFELFTISDNELLKDNSFFL